MRDILGPGTHLGYCTNVHPGVTLDAVRANLLAHALPIKRRVSPEAPMGVGLWFAYDAAAQLLEDPAQIADLRRWMTDQGLYTYTLNGFPFGDFHEARVKTRVYQPDWTTPQRYNYTLALATILSELLPDGLDHGGISTLPLGWPHPEAPSGGGIPHRTDLTQPASPDPTYAKACAAQLTNLTHYLARIELDTGKCIHVDLEPEPGCYLDTAPGVVDFFETYLLGTPDDATIRGYLRVCHDVCHSAVMFEDQGEALAAYRAAGLLVGKVQLSSALHVNFDGMAPSEHAHALAELRRFAEDRYQHQTAIRFDDGSTAFYADLPEALQAQGHTPAPPAGQWRVHYHVPLDLDRAGPIETTRDAVAQCLGHLQPQHQAQLFEVETYAWEVLPPELRRSTLAEGIADELAWAQQHAGGACRGAAW